MTRLARRLAMVAVALASAVPLLAQTYHGGLRGAVRESGGVVPGVNVTIVNEANGSTRSTATNTAGEYAFVQVEPGTYTIRIQMQGFKTIERKSVRIGTQQFITMDHTLEVGALEEQVTVEGGDVVLETSNASVASTIDSKTLETLPTAGRNPFFLSITTPGVVPTGDPQFVRQQDQTNSSLLSLGGGPRRGNNYTLDGVSIVDMRNRATVIPSIEAVEEVKVQVSTYDAEMGRTGGGVFNMTGKSGANAWHGSALFQNRPKGTFSLPYFAQKACDEGTGSCEKADTYFYLYGGSVGGPVIKNKTFFWASVEGYKTKTPSNDIVIVPTDLELSGDFSQSGVTIYDPLTTVQNADGSYSRSPFPGNRIPTDRISPVAQNLRQYWPQAGSATAGLVDVSVTGTFKLDQIWNEKVRSSAMYAIYDSTEPAPRYFLGEIGENPGDPGDGALYRTVHALAINNTITPNPNTVAHVRLGYTSFSDDCVPTAFDPGTLGFSPAYVNSVPQQKFPYFYVGGYGTGYFGRIFGDRAPQDTDFYSWDVNASMSKLWGRHTVKFGASYRQIGMKNTSFGQSSGSFTFDGLFTGGPDPLNATTGDPHGLAALLLGFPSNGSITVATPNDFYINYYAGYIQDDFRVNRKLTVNLGLRYEFEQGLQEKDNAFTVGFDRTRPWDVQAPGVQVRGGLMYAGVDGYPTHQSDPGKANFAPRLGFAYSATDKTVIRGGYGLYYAPFQYAFPTEDRLGARGFTEVTDYVASFDDGLTPCPTCNIVNPFPNGFSQPPGSSLGIQTGAGGSVNFVDQFRKNAKVHQYSFDIQHEIPGRIVVGLGYIGSTTRNLGVGGNDSGTVNINQLDPQYQSLGTALLDQVPNPFFGNSAFGAFANQSTISRGQLLRPYPQFGDLLAHQVSDGRAQYHSVVFRLERPMVGGWGGRMSYTYSKAESNIFGELNAFSNNSGNLNRAVDAYDLDREYATALPDTPHRLVFAGTVELPFGRGKKHLSEPGIARTLFGGWSITGVGTYQTGFPVVVNQANNNAGVFGRLQRPNRVGDPATSGSTYDHYDSSCGCIANWFNESAWTAAPAYTFGNAPRTDTGMRTPFKAQTDIAFQKIEPLGPGDLMIRFEMINIFNNVQFNGPNSTFGASSFGRITGTRGFPRLLQITLRYGF